MMLQLQAMPRPIFSSLRTSTPSRLLHRPLTHHAPISTIVIHPTATIATSAFSHSSIVRNFTQSHRATLRSFSTIPSSTVTTPTSSTTTSTTPSSTTPVSELTPPTTTATTVTEADPTKVKKLPIKQRLTNWLEKNKLKLINFSIAGGISYGIYSLYSFSFDLIDFYLEHREVDAPYLAYLTGVAATLLSLGVYRVTRRLYVLNARRMYREVLKTVFASDVIRARLGEDVKRKTLARMQKNGRIGAVESVTPSVASSSSTLTTTTPTPRAIAPYFRYASFLPFELRYRPTREGWFRYVQPRRLQLCFWVEGSEGGGLVTAEIEQAIRGEYDDLNLCVVDLLQQGEQIVLKSHYLPEKMKQDLLSLDEEKKGISQQRDLLSKKVTKI